LAHSPETIHLFSPFDDGHNIQYKYSSRRPVCPASSRNAAVDPEKQPNFTVDRGVPENSKTKSGRPAPRDAYRGAPAFQPRQPLGVADLRFETSFELPLRGNFVPP
jgi:hypothetical protein